MTKFRMYYDKDKETEFLNEMSWKGYAMTGFCMCFYHFDQCRPGEYVYQIDLAEGFFRVSNDYREFMRDMGVEIVCLWGPWVILRKRAAEGPFVLYTDAESCIEHYTKIRRIFKACAAVEACCFFLELGVALNGDGGAKVFAKVFTIVVGLMFFIFVRGVVRINGILAMLNARLGVDMEEAGGIGGRKSSGFLAAGLVLNGICLMLPEKWGIRYFGQIIACLLMLVGIIRICQNRRSG